MADLFDVPVCLSGGAEGADLQWGMTSGKAGHVVRHFSFVGHRTEAPPVEVVVLTADQLQAADPFIAKANKTLKRRWPVKSQFVANLLRRNYYQVAWSDAVYAVAAIDEKGLVEGGTAWATQMFQDRFEGAPCPAYVYDQKRGLWTVWEGSWVVIDVPPPPSGVWAGIGSRKLTDQGKNAIRQLMGYVKQ